jgi:cyclase
MVRIIPRLDIKGPNLVKGIHLEGLRVLGDPKEYANFYYKAGADELIFQDVVASLYQRNSLNNIIEQTAQDIFIPLTVGGGLRTLNDIKDVLRAGADKVSINTAAINNPEFIREASLEFGSSTICIALEINQQSNGEYLCYTDNGREYTGINALEWAKKAEALGAGELIITSINKDGTKKGMDTSLIEKISNNASIPIIAHGGLGDELCHHPRTGKILL